MVDSRAIQYVILTAFAIYLVVYFRFDEWFKEAPQPGIRLEDISQQRVNHYYTKFAEKESSVLTTPSKPKHNSDTASSSSKEDSEAAENPAEEESRLQQIFRALSSPFSSSSDSSSCDSSEDSEDEFLLSHGISMDKSVLNKVKQAMVDEDEQRADRLIHDIIQKIKLGRLRLAEQAKLQKKEEEEEEAAQQTPGPGRKPSGSGKPSSTEKKDEKKKAPKDDCDLKWPTFTTGQRYEYERVEGFQISESFVWSGAGCLKGAGEQCSAATVEDASQLCDTFKECLGFTCNKGRGDCQLRFPPLKHLDTPHFTSYYKPGMREMADKREKCDVANVNMQKGSLAADDFNWNGACGVDHKCVISYGLYGSNPKYTDGAVRNVELQPKIFPGWVVRIYHDESVPQSILDELTDKGAELIKVTGIGGGIAGMFWRFLVADDETVDRYIIRDSDSRLNAREKGAVDEWIASGYSIHSIRDHPNHHRGLNGGMWGGVRGAIKNMRDMISTANRGGYGADLDFLNNKVWPAVLSDQISHDSYSCQHYRNSHPFPTERKNYEHVGQVFEHNQPRMSDITCCLTNNPAPVSCRKKKEWTYG